MTRAQLREKVEEHVGAFSVYGQGIYFPHKPRGHEERENEEALNELIDFIRDLIDSAEHLNNTQNG